MSNECRDTWIHFKRWCGLITVKQLCYLGFLSRVDKEGLLRKCSKYFHRYFVWNYVHIIWWGKLFYLLVEGACDDAIGDDNHDVESGENHQFEAHGKGEDGKNSEFGESDWSSICFFCCQIILLQDDVILFETIMQNTFINQLLFGQNIEYKNVY